MNVTTSPALTPSRLGGWPFTSTVTTEALPARIHRSRWALNDKRLAGAEHLLQHRLPILPDLQPRARIVAAVNTDDARDWGIIGARCACRSRGGRGYYADAASASIRSGGWRVRELGGVGRAVAKSVVAAELARKSAQRRHLRLRALANIVQRAEQQVAPADQHQHHKEDPKETWNHQAAHARRRCDRHNPDRLADSAFAAV